MKQIDFTIPRSAIFSDDRKYRYVLWRVWSPNKGLLLVIGLNPSTANEISDDPTIARLLTRASLSGFGGLLMANLYAYVSTDPKELLRDSDLSGAENDFYLKYLIGISDKTLCGWGSFSPVVKRAPAVLTMIPDPYCLGVNADGQPKHPLYVSYDTPMVKYSSGKVGI